MFLQFFGLKDNPFKLAFELTRLFLGKHHEEALAHLRYAVAEGEGFSVITGASGVGKSTVCRAFVESLQGVATVAFFSSPIISPIDLLQRMNRSFGIPADAQTTNELIDALNAFLMRQRIAGRKVVVFIDDAQMLAAEVLEQVRLISNLETTREKLIQIVLVGKPELMQLLNSHQLRQMGQRVSVRYEIGPLTEDETTAYIQHRLSIASAGPPVRFSREALRHIFRHARGNPRRVNIVCSSILAAAFKLRQKEINGELAQTVIQDIERLDEGGALNSRPHRLPAWALAWGGFLRLTTAAFFVFRPAPTHPRFEPAGAEPYAVAPSVSEEPIPPTSQPLAAIPEVQPPPGAVNRSTALPEIKPEEVPGGGKKAAMTHSVQIGAYLLPENAQNEAAHLNAKGYPARIIKITDAKGRVWHMVRIGDHPNRLSAQAQADDFKRREQKQSVVRPFGLY